MVFILIIYNCSNLIYNNVIVIMVIDILTTKIINPNESLSFHLYHNVTIFSVFASLITPFLSISLSFSLEILHDFAYFCEFWCAING